MKNLLLLLVGEAVDPVEDELSLLDGLHLLLDTSSQEVDVAEVILDLDLFLLFHFFSFTANAAVGFSLICLPRSSGYSPSADGKKDACQGVKAPVGVALYSEGKDEPLPLPGQIAELEKVCPRTREGEKRNYVGGESGKLLRRRKIFVRISPHAKFRLYQDFR